MTLTFSSTHARVPKEELAALAQQLAPEIARMRAATQKGYEDERASINLPFDTAMHDRIRELADQCEGTELVIVVGIGGSNLGTIAVQEAVLGKLHNQLASPRILYADTVDTRSMTHILTIMKRTLETQRRVIIIGISKSGGTTETIANFEVLVEQHRANGGRASDVFVITGEGSAFWHRAHEEGFCTLPIPAQVGGRYSVLSAVGLFPLALLGIDTAQLLEGARAMRDACLQDPPENPAALSAMLLAYHAAHGRNIADTFLFATDFESIGKWYRQLMGESIGKEHNREGEQVWNGMTPTVSIGSTDLHSMAQLYLGGPQDKFTTFITVQDEAVVRVPKWERYDALVPHIQGRPLSELMDAIVRGVQTAFEKFERPFCTISLPDRSAWNIGNLLQFKMMEMMYLGFLMHVNPFDQPAVERYKVETKRLLEEKQG
ncbi:hypothetical protein D6789_04565 [Candidatus Woesearchaeota archaeon]|nr:MAG: hypothetical protein D6789_04565 [Candidatus Woesearchaeota archaeon]